MSRVSSLLRNDGILYQNLIAIVGDLREVVGRFRISNLLIRFRRHDGGDQLTRFHHRALVHEHVFHVAGNFRVDRRLVKAMDLARQSDRARGPLSVQFRAQNGTPSRRFLCQAVTLIAERKLTRQHYSGCHDRCEQREGNPLEIKAETAGGCGEGSFSHRVYICSSFAASVSAQVRRICASRCSLLIRVAPTNEYTIGITSSVMNVAAIRPPITARPRGAFSPPPPPSSSDIRTLPRIIASAVLRTGRNPVVPASMAAVIGSTFSFS